MKSIEKYLINENINSLTNEDIKTKKFKLKYDDKIYEFYLNDYGFPSVNKLSIIESIIKKENLSFHFDLNNRELFINNREANLAYKNHINDILCSEIT